MCRAFISITILLLFVCTQLFPQAEIHKFTISVTDTNASKLEQARDIYNWITTNIQYDVKAYKKFDYTGKPIGKILDTRKGLCYDYSGLFTAMCRSVGIEAYSIAGYNKSFTYYKGKPFLRAEHTWNVFYTGSSWHIVDATWGSGRVVFKPRNTDKLLYHLLRRPYSNKNMMFVPGADTLFFNIPADTLSKTHYSLDPKWLFTDNPVSYQYFETGTGPIYVYNPEFTGEIEAVRGKSDEYVYKADGIKSNTVNPLNFFDLAYGYYNMAQWYDIQRPVSASNSWQFEKYLSEYNIILQSVNRHKSITDSVYRERFKNLKGLLSVQKRMTGKIKTKARSAEKSFKSGKEQILGKNASYRKKQESFLINAGKTELKRIKQVTRFDSVDFKAEEFSQLYKQASGLKAKEGSYLYKADSLLGSIDVHIANDARYDDSIFADNVKFNQNIISLNNLILAGHEDSIRAYVDSLSYVYNQIAGLFEQKKGTKSKLQETSKLYYAYSGEYQKLLKEQMALLSKMYKISNYSDSLMFLHNSCTDNLIKSYRHAIKFTQKAASHGMLQKDIRKDNLTALKQQKKNIVKENKFFEKWYIGVYKTELARYNFEKEIIKEIKSNTQRNQKLVETKLKKYRESKQQ
ncbi:MAG: transglutaminase domain-containing protein [Bacteroidales bacterium]|nr:transglutaminase domain-containing protein [Bacteroidales bacterium]